MGDGPSSGQKWTCSLCTFYNWPASIKCTICSAPKQSDQASACLPSVSNVPVSDPQWTCPVCTYGNFAKSRSCVQCRTVSPTTAGNLPSSALQSTSAQATSCSPNSANSEDSGNYQAPGKWTCTNCTYNNWAKSKHCVMCKVARYCPADKSLAPTKRVGQIFQPESLWLKACKAVLTGNLAPVETFLLQSGNNIDRRLTRQDCRYLENLSLQHSEIKPRLKLESLTPGLSLLDLALCCQRMDVFHLILSHSENRSGDKSLANANDLEQEFDPYADDQLKHDPSGSGASNKSRGVNNIATTTTTTAGSKRTPCLASPMHARELRRCLLSIMRQHKSDFACTYFTEWHTFALPAEIHGMPQQVKSLLLGDLCDQQVQHELEQEAKAINWWAVKRQKQLSRLYALWNRSAGDCLLDSVLQACWGIFDRDNTLRQALFESLRACEADFYPRWREYEIRLMSHSLPDYAPEEHQFQRDWRGLCKTASLPREALEQFHVFVLSHILRRPIIIYGVKLINNYRAEPVGIAHFQGIYLPLLWSRSFCSKNPIILGYTKGHFSALVPCEPASFCKTTCASSDSLLGAGDEVTAASSNENQPMDPLASSMSGNEFDLENLPYSPSMGHSPSPSSEENEQQPPHLQQQQQQHAQQQHHQQQGYVYLPLFDSRGNQLTVHFTSRQESRNARQLLHDWLDVVSTKLELPLCRMKIQRSTGPVQHMTNTWLKPYREMSMTDQTATGLLQVMNFEGSAESNNASPTRQRTRRHSLAKKGSPYQRSRVASTSSTKCDSSGSSSTTDEDSVISTPYL